METARVYQATCYVGLGKPELADEPLRQAIRKNPQMRRPDSLLFPQRVIDRWISVKDSMVGELRAAEQAAIEKARRERGGSFARRQRALGLLSHDGTLRAARGRGRAEPSLDRGDSVRRRAVSERQRGARLDFLGTEAALGLTALTALNVHSHLQTKADEARERGGSAGPDVNARLDDWHLALTLSTYGLLGVAALGIGEAQLSFVPEIRTVRERPLPKMPGPATGLTVAPRVSGGPGKLELGVSGTF